MTKTQKASLLAVIALAVAVTWQCLNIDEADAQARAAFTKHKPDLALAVDAKDEAFVDFLESPWLGLSQAQLILIEEWLIPDATPRQQLQSELTVRRAYRRIGFASDNERVKECESEIARLEVIVNTESIGP